ncbi:MAG: bifunctional riboflavin kinase/FAD synthetase [Balneolaceae bacterium]
MAKLVYLKDVERAENTVLTVGTFDGVHAGHRFLINTVVNKARKKNARSVIVTFDPHPREIIDPGFSGIRLLTTLEERCEILQELGIDLMVVIPFDRDFSLLTSREFVQDIIWKKIGVGEFVIGYDHQFGKDREGSIETVKKLGKKLGFASYVVTKQEVADKTVSSTKIRNALEKEGNVKEAALLLMRYYQLSGTVVHGEKRGQRIGYPTANVLPSHSKKVIPKNGVYAVWVQFQDQFYGGMMNIGFRPTFGIGEKSIEVHILDFNGDIYGEKLLLQFVDRIRDEVKFNTPEKLKEQLERDKNAAREILNENKPVIAKHKD